MRRTKRILLTGGGSGVHVYPLVAVAEALRPLAEAQQASVDLYYLGPDDQYRQILDKAGIRTYGLAAGKIRRYVSLANFLDIPKFFIGLIQAFAKVFWIMPDAIFSKGGTGAFAVVFAGWFYRIPVVIHESDTVPGLTNLASSRFAKRIAVGFEIALQYFNPRKAVWTGNPVRSDLLKNQMNPGDAKHALHFDAETPLLLILGGSLGSQRINEFILPLLKELLHDTQVLHQTGFANYEEVKKLSQAALLDVSAGEELRTRYQAFPYLERDMRVALAAADLVVTRAGASNIFEIAAYGKPAILIPLLESANDHQRVNAYEFSKTGAAIVIEEPNLLPGIFLSQVKELLGNQNALRSMAKASLGFFRSNAAELISQEILKLV